MGKVDKNRILLMKQQQLTNKTIAERLGISVKTVQRALKNTTFKKCREDFEIEKFRRDIYLKFESGSRVAERFGITRQAVSK